MVREVYDSLFFPSYLSFPLEGKCLEEAKGCTGLSRDMTLYHFPDRQSAAPPPRSKRCTANTFCTILPSSTPTSLDGVSLDSRVAGLPYESSSLAHHSPLRGPLPLKGDARTLRDRPLYLKYSMTKCRSLLSGKGGGAAGTGGWQGFLGKFEAP